MKTAIGDEHDARVLLVTPEIAEPLSAFFREAWDDRRSPDELRRSMVREAATNPSTPGATPPAVAFMSDGAVVGYVGNVPVTFWNGAVETPAYWTKPLMVLPDFRNGPVGFSILREVVKHIGLSALIAVAPPARRLFAAVGYRDCGLLPNYIFPLRPGRIARSLDVQALGLGLPAWLDRLMRAGQRLGLAATAGGMIGLGLSAFRAVRRPRGSMRINIGGGLPPRDEVDALWAEARATFVAAAVRDGTFLPWRYSPASGATYEAVSVYDPSADGRLAGLAIVRRPARSPDPRLKGIKVASMSDILFKANEPAAGRAAVIGAERLARRMGADALLCTTAHPAIEAVLRHLGYARLPGNVHFMIRDPGGSAGLPTDAAQWWLTRGDAFSDEVF